MNIELRVKWLLFILNQNCEKGFNDFQLISTLILVVGFSIFVLDFISGYMPSNPRNINKGKQAEGKQYVSSINKAQQAYYTDNAKFVTENTPEGWASLAVGIKTQTSNYKYSISPIGKEGVNTFADATQINKKLKNYTGVVRLVEDPNNPGKKISQAIVCETYKAGDIPMPGEVTEKEVKCPRNSRLLQ
ncbi:hypothetical protein NIES2119_31585 [[Phormidium ambiguum] IAM M-71]|uniref:General secretion pathway protein GspH n=1 Tax=[Phormidium ambiguum] IAM M-71 TaxID=454136 RepID=A0A1U7I223_9CYAN|nr:type IV pilin-like G/H family protein [Phormidium ambiguum]OKH30088.1 hypothetical protein NIES2119_31585 [Phormidium ambiguum IAM M-71]